MNHHHLTTWRKSSYSSGTQNCVEIAAAGAAMLVRDSKHPTEGHLRFTRAELAAFVAACRAGEYDSLLRSEH
jgi:hypothetical protein